MNVAEMIQWLQTMPQDAKVEVVYHTSGRGYYDQGGNATTVDFDATVDYSYSNTMYGKHFELKTYKDGVTVLQIGTTNN